MARIVLTASILVAIGTVASAGQSGGYAPAGGGAGAPPSEQQNASTRPYDVEKSGEFQDRAQLLSGKNADKERAAALEQSQKILAAIHLACEPSAAEPVGRGRAQFDNKKVQVAIYEVACSNGLGYLLVAKEGADPYATSCFSADKMRAAELAKGHKTELYCQLPGNKDVNAMAAALMSTAGTSCNVRTVQWYGRSVMTNSEYEEVVCDNGAGYMLRTAQAGSTEPTSVMACAEAAQRGVPCHLTP
ncbi:MAG TPA: hypothetical protein VGF89_05675 [Steroidobacteraceae bacterium]|jgi:hypothetical protein